MPTMPNMPSMERLWRARDYVSASNGAKGSKGSTLDVSDVNESQTLPMEDSAADEFIDMRVGSERAPMVNPVSRPAVANGSLSRGEGVAEATGFGGGFGGGGGSGIGRGGAGQVRAPPVGRSLSMTQRPSSALDDNQ